MVLTMPLPFSRHRRLKLLDLRKRKASVSCDVLQSKKTVLQHPLRRLEHVLALALILDSFHCFAHIAPPFFCILELTNLPLSNVEIHFRCVAAQEIVHQLADFGLGFMTYAERSAPVLPRADAFRLPLCLAFVMFFSLFARGTLTPSGNHYTLFLVFTSRGARLFVGGVMVLYHISFRCIAAFYDILTNGTAALRRYSVNTTSHWRSSVLEITNVL